jgi:phosphoribosylformylglycinamidine synthase
MRVGVENSPYLVELPTDRDIELPIAHAEGRFVAPEGAAERYLEEGLVALRYADDINGSSLNIAGLQDKSGRVFGLMPHPERFIYKRHHYDPDWSADPQYGWGYYIFSSIYRECSGARQFLAAATAEV